LWPCAARGRDAHRLRPGRGVDQGRARGRRRLPHGAALVLLPCGAAGQGRRGNARISRRREDVRSERGVREKEIASAGRQRRAIRPGGETRGGRAATAPGPGGPPPPAAGAGSGRARGGGGRSPTPPPMPTVPLPGLASNAATTARASAIAAADGVNTSLM